MGQSRDLDTLKLKFLQISESDKLDPSLIGEMNQIVQNLDANLSKLANKMSKQNFIEATTELMRKALLHGAKTFTPQEKLSLYEVCAKVYSGLEKTAGEIYKENQLLKEKMMGLRQDLEKLAPTPRQSK